MRSRRKSCQDTSAASRIGGQSTANQNTVWHPGTCERFRRARDRQHEGFYRLPSYSIGLCPISTFGVQLMVDDERLLSGFTGKITTPPALGSLASTTYFMSTLTPFSQHSDAQCLRQCVICDRAPHGVAGWLVVLQARPLHLNER